MHVDYLCGANLSAERTIGALSVINYSVVILHVDGIKFTALFAQLTGDTADAADVLCNAALIDGAAANHHTHLVRNDLDELIGTNLSAGTAADTSVAIHYCNAVFNIDCSIIADLDAVTKAQTSLLAGTSASVKQLIGRTVLIALIIH